MIISKTLGDLIDYYRPTKSWRINSLGQVAKLYVLHRKNNCFAFPEPERYIGTTLRQCDETGSYLVISVGIKQVQFTLVIWKISLCALTVQMYRML